MMLQELNRGGCFTIEERGNRQPFVKAQVS
jgi:hypothetical protein